MKRIRVVCLNQSRGRWKKIREDYWGAEHWNSVDIINKHTQKEVVSGETEMPIEIVHEVILPRVYSSSLLYLLLNCEIELNACVDPLTVLSSSPPL